MFYMTVALTDISLLSLAGFGNLRGNIEIWDLATFDRWQERRPQPSGSHYETPHSTEPSGLPR